MLIRSRALLFATIVIAMSVGSVRLIRAEVADFDAAVESVVRGYLEKHPEEIEKIVRDYLIKHPELMQAAILDFAAKRAAVHAKQATPAPAAPDKAAAVKGNAAALLSSAHQVTLGNPDGDIVMVEFFDYNCGFCKRALADMLALLETEPRLKIILKELPILGEGSAEAARVAVAVRMQDASGARYLQFHRSLLGGRGPANKDRALVAAREAGLDMTRLDQDMASDEVRATLAESFDLAKNLGINGTPSYVIGDNVVIGAVGLPTLQAKLVAARR